jgi:O-antigen ligase
VTLAAGVAYLLYLRSPVVYASVVWWLFFLTCFVRRIIDYRSGFSDQNVVLAAPLVAAMVCAPTLLTQRHLWKLPIALPFVLAFASALYGICVGVLCIPPKILLESSLQWIPPLVFGFFMFAECISAEKREAHMKSLRQTFKWGLLIMGAYGIYQYVVMPPWDALWMTGSGMGSIGSPEPFGMRVFSTMNGPGVLGYTLAAGLVLIVSERNLFSYCAGAVGLCALLLSSVRAAWAMLVIALFLFLLREKKYIARVLLGIIALGLVAMAAVAISPARDSIQDRFSSFTDLRDDTSYQERTEGYSQLLPYALDAPFGSGLGTMDAHFQGNISLGTRDSGLWEIVLSLGWIGGLVYLLALARLAFSAWQHTRKCTEEYTAIACIVLGLLSQIAMGSMMLGFTGLAIWSFGAMAMARSALHESTSRRETVWLPDPAAA